MLKESIKNSKKEDQIKIIVIDDGSTDGSTKWIKKNYSDIIILKGRGELWWSGAVNLGIKHALNNLKKEYILLWNIDTKPERQYFMHLFEILKDIVGPLFIYSGPPPVFVKVS